MIIFVKFCSLPGIVSGIDILLVGESGSEIHEEEWSDFRFESSEGKVLGVQWIYCFWWWVIIVPAGAEHVINIGDEPRHLRL